MEKIDSLIFGYRKIIVPREHLSRVASVLLSRGIFCEIKADGSISVRDRDAERVKKIISHRAEYTMTDSLGLIGRLKRMKHKTAILLGTALTILLCLMSSNTVWDIRVDGNERIPDSAIIYELSRCGLEVGDSWSSVDSGEIENGLLQGFDKLSWININRRGSVAYVTVIEKDNIKEEEIQVKVGYANVIAECDAVIQEITVTHGVAAVKPGDVVKKGDLLIYGIIPEESGGGYCYAEGRVLGIVSDTVDTTLERNYEEKTKSSMETVELSVKIFDFSLNLFKKYGNSYKDCDIIVDRNTFSLFGKCKLPLEITTRSATEYTVSESAYTDTELVDTCLARHTAEVNYLLSDADLLKIRTWGEFTDTGYRMSSSITYSADIGVENPFLVN